MGLGLPRSTADASVNSTAPPCSAIAASTSVYPETSRAVATALGLKSNPSTSCPPTACMSKAKLAAFGKLALWRLLLAQDHASGYLDLRPASAKQPTGPRWPAISGVLSTHRCHGLRASWHCRRRHNRSRGLWYPHFQRRHLVRPYEPAAAPRQCPKVRIPYRSPAPQTRIAAAPRLSQLPARGRKHERDGLGERTKRAAELSSRGRRRRTPWSRRRRTPWSWRATSRRREEREDTPWMMKRGEKARQEFHNPRTGRPLRVPPLHGTPWCLRSHAASHLRAWARGERGGVPAGRSRTCARHELRANGVAACIPGGCPGAARRACKKCLAPRFVSPRPVLPRACLRRATVSATQLGYARTTCAFVLIQA